MRVVLKGKSYKTDKEGFDALNKALEAQPITGKQVDTSFNGQYADKILIVESLENDLKYIATNTPSYKIGLSIWMKKARLPRKLKKKLSQSDRYTVLSKAMSKKKIKVLKEKWCRGKNTESN